MYFYKRAYQDKQNVASQKADLVCLSIFSPKLSDRFMKNNIQKFTKKGLWSMNLQL